MKKKENINKCLVFCVFFSEKHEKILKILNSNNKNSFHQTMFSLFSKIILTNNFKKQEAKGPWFFLFYYQKQKKKH